MNSLKNRFKEEILPKLQKELGIKNPMRVPMLLKIVINMGVKNTFEGWKFHEWHDFRDWRNSLNHSHSLSRFLGPPWHIWPIIFPPFRP